MKALIKSLIPPLLLRGIHRLRYGPPPPPEWEVVPGGWPAQRPGGWSHASISETQRRKWPKYLDLIRAPRPLSVSHEAPDPDDTSVASHNALMSYGYALALACGGAKRISILDFGCGAGHYFPLTRELLPGVEIEYVGHDLPHLCAVAREFNPGAVFHDRQEPCWNRSYDFVLASGSLQYEVGWRETVRNLASVTGRHLFVTRLPSVFASAAFVVVQRVHAYGYDTEYPGWVFNRREFLDAVRGHGLILVREFMMLDAPQIRGSPERVSYRGFLFRRPDGGTNA